MASTDENTGADAWAEASRKLRDQQLAPQVANSISNAASVNPDGAAKSNIAARFLGIPPESAAAFPDDVARQVKVQQLDPPGLVGKSPVLARFLTVQSTANAMHDDIPNASSIEQVAKQAPAAPLVPTQPSLMSDLWTGVKHTALNVLGAWDKGAVAISDALPEGTPGKMSPEERAMYSDRGQFMQASGAEPANSPQRWSGMVTSGLTYAPFSAAAPLVMAGTEGTALSQNLQTQGVDAATANKAGAIGGAVMGLANYIPMGNLVVGQGAAPFLRSLLGASIKAGAVGAGQSVVGDAATSVLLGRAGYEKQAEEMAPSWAKAAESALFMGGMHIGMQGIHLAGGVVGQVREQHQAAAAEKDFNQISQLGQLSAASKWRERDPQAFKEFVQNVTEDGEMSHVYVKAETFAQSLDKAGVTADELRVKMPEVAAQMAEALQTKGDVAIPTADYATHIAGGPMDSVLLQHLKTDPEGKTYAEAQQFYQDQAAQMKDIATKLVADKAEQDAFRESQQAVQDQIHNQLDELGRQPTDVNKINATVQAAILSRIAAREGISPTEALGKYGAKVAGEAQGGLEQPARVTPEQSATYSDAIDKGNHRAALRILHDALGISDNDASIDRGGAHSPSGPEDGSPAYDVSKNGIYPEDVYSHNGLKYYGTGEDKLDLEAHAIIKRLEGRPNAPVTIYRAVEKDGPTKIQPGEWVTTVRQYAKDHGEGNVPDGYKIIKMDVKARDVFTSGDSWLEWGYHPQAFKPEIPKGEAKNKTLEERVATLSGNPNILEQTARGTYNPSTQTISLLKGADLSTYLHETGHWALDTYGRIAASENAPPEIRGDMEKILKWFGVESLDKWNSMTLDEQRPLHEQFARGFEAYLMEGKAPSQELAGPFARIRAWMVDIYKSLRELHVDLTSEVRGVFDRMLAGEDAIHQAESARVFEPLFTEKPPGMTAEEWASYRDVGQEATNEAIDQMQTRSMRDMKWLSNAKSKAMKDLQKQAKAARDDVRAQVEKDVLNEPVYQMQDWLKANSKTSEADRVARQEWAERRDSQEEKTAEAVKAEYLAKPEAADLKGLEKGQYISRMRREMAVETSRRMLEWEKQNKKPQFAKPDIDMELVAERFGFGSGEEAMRALADAPPRASVIDGMTDRRMLEEHGELSSRDAIETAANEAVHNAARSRFMATGLKVLADSPISARTLLNGAREAAEGAIAAKLVRDVNPRQYLAAETRANKEAIKLAPTDPAGAVQAQRAALLNNQLVKAAYDAQDLVRKALAYAKSFDRDSKRLKIEPEERDMIDGLLARFDFRQQPPTGPSKKQLQLAQWVESQKALGYTPAEVPDMLNEAVRMHYKDMTIEQLRGLMDTIRSIEKVGRERHTVTVGGQRMDVQEAVAPIVAKMRERGEKFTDAELAERPRYGVDPLWRVSLDRVQSLLRAGMSEFLRPDYKGNKYDMHEILGPFQKAFTERLFKAGYDHGDFMDHVAQLKKDRMQRYGLDKDWQKTLDTVVADHNLMDNSLEVPTKRRLTRGDLIGIAMHVGNESNFDKLVRGMRWQPADIWKALHDNMSEKDWNAARTLGEMAGAKWTDMAAMNRRLGNDNPEKIEPRPFPTKYGEMPGWYSPIDYDPVRSRLGKRKADAKAVNPGEGLFSSNYYRADTTTNGSLNSRASGYYDFVNLDWRPIEKRIGDTMRDLAYREALIDVHKLYTNKDLARQFQRTYGPEEYKHLGDWLGRLVNSEVGDEKQSVLTAISAGSRRAMVANGVAFRISTMIKHGGSAAFKSTGYFAGGGERYFGSRLAAMMTDHNAQVVEALAKFPEIRQRARQQDRDFAQAVGSLFEPESIHGKAERFGHAGVAAMDFFTAVPTAHAAYDWAITEGVPKRLGGTGKPMSEADAIQFASKVVREAHGSTNEASQSLLINNKSEIVKALTTLHGFMNNAFGQTVDAYDKAFKAEGFGKPELLARTLFAQVVPAIMAGWVTFGGPNKDETWAGWMLHHIGGEFAGMLPMVREGWSAGVEGFSSAGLPPWIRALTDTVKVVKDTVKEVHGEEVKNPIKHVGNAAGLLLPGLGQVGSTTQFLYDEVTGKQHAETVADWVRGVMTGTAKRDH